MKADTDNMNAQYLLWAARHPQAAAELEGLMGAYSARHADEDAAVAQGRSENWAQQQVRLAAAQRGWKSWRNNVGATPHKTPAQCPACHFKYEIKQTPHRYGLCNDSAQLNAQFKSADLILAIPRVITPQDVGTTISQFGSVEVKKPGWSFNPNDEHEQAQARWAQLLLSIGAYATFSTGGLK